MYSALGVRVLSLSSPILPQDSNIWATELDLGLDAGNEHLRRRASQYKDYVLVLLFIKYVSDKYAGVPYAPITIPEGASAAPVLRAARS